jgi:hypothetical protein
MTFFWCFRGLLSFSPAALCSRISGLSPKQKKLCIESPDAVVALGIGHALGARECQYQLAGETCRSHRSSQQLLLLGHRWNCSEVWKKDVFGHVITVGELKQLIFKANQTDVVTGKPGFCDVYKLTDFETWLILTPAQNGIYSNSFDKLKVIFMEIWWRWWFLLVFGKHLAECLSHAARNRWNSRRV